MFKRNLWKLVLCLGIVAWAATQLVPLKNVPFSTYVRTHASAKQAEFAKLLDEAAARVKDLKAASDFVALKQIGAERKIHAYDRDNGKELWQASLPNGAEGMMATYQVNGRQFIVLPVAQPPGTFPMTFNNAARGAGPAPAPPAAAPAAAAPAPPAAGAAPPQGGAPAGDGRGGGRGGRGGGGPQLPAAYIAFALPQ